MSRRIREIKKCFKVFCEGDTEYRYIDGMRRLKKLFIYKLEEVRNERFQYRRIFRRFGTFLFLINFNLPLQWIQSYVYNCSGKYFI